MNDAEYWDQLYHSGETNWDIGYASTPLKTYIDGLNDKSIRILIPGCGNAYEAAYLLEKGFFNVTLVDISAAVTSKVEHRLKGYGASAKIVTANFFDMEGRFDLILEQTFFCALPPALRQRYADKMFELLSNGGCLAGVLFNRSFEGGPPYGGDEQEYRELFSPAFDIEIMEPCYNSIKPRMGTELFIQLRKKTQL